jgi:hypothetical protein
MNCEGLQYLKQKCSHIGESNIKYGTYVRPYIKMLITGNAFGEALNNSKVSQMQHSSDNQQSQNYSKFDEGILEVCKELGHNMSLKIHFSDSRVDNFCSEYLGGSDKHGQKFPRGNGGMVTERWKPNYACRLLGTYHDGTSFNCISHIFVK